MSMMLQVIAKKSGLFVARKSAVSLSIPQSIALRNHVKGGTNGLYQMKQALEAFAPGLKGLLPASIRKHVSAMEKEGVVPVIHINLRCRVTKAGNKSGICTYYYSSRPHALLAAMLRRMYLDHSVELS